MRTTWSVSFGFYAVDVVVARDALRSQFAGPRSGLTIRHNKRY